MTAAGFKTEKVRRKPNTTTYSVSGRQCVAVLTGDGQSATTNLLMYQDVVRTTLGRSV